MIWPVLFICATVAALYLIAPLLPANAQQQKLQISLFIALFIGASLGTYSFIGSPHLSQSWFISSPSDRPQPNIDARKNTLAQTAPPQVSPEQITAMVGGLAARLADNPEDPDGWTRLIRSRIVLGDITQLIQDHKTMSQTYATRPEIIEKISQDSGFNALAARLIRQE